MLDTFSTLHDMSCITQVTGQKNHHAQLQHLSYSQDPKSLKHCVLVLVCDVTSEWYTSKSTVLVTADDVREQLEAVQQLIEAIHSEMIAIVAVRHAARRVPRLGADAHSDDPETRKKVIQRGLWPAARWRGLEGSMKIMYGRW